MTKTAAMAVIAGLFISVGASRAHGQAPAAVAPARPSPPELLFRLALENTARLPIGPGTVTNPNLDLQVYGEGALISVGKAEHDPHTFNGLCEKPCGMTMRDKNNYFDLRGKARIQWTLTVSGFHRARPLIKLADGTLLVGDQADGSVADWHVSDVSLAEVRWIKLDAERGVTLGQFVEHPDLSKVDEVGYFDVIPGSGVRVAGMPLEKIPNPPPGGWIAISAFELWGKPVSRENKASQ